MYQPNNARKQSMGDGDGERGGSGHRISLQSSQFPYLPQKKGYIGSNQSYSSWSHDYLSGKYHQGQVS